jgi:uncharacterized protein GlcG (DUF336 family)
MKALVIIAAALAAAGSAVAQAPPGSTLVGNTKPLAGPSLALSLEAAQAAMAACKAKGAAVGVTVLDDTGGLRVVLGADGALAADANGSRRSANLSAAQKASGADIVERAKTDKALADQIAANKDWLAREGAVQIKSGDKVVGIIAVEGHPHDPARDIACAQAGIDKISARLR